MLNRKTVSYSNLARLIAHFNVFLSKIGQAKQARPSGPGAACLARRRVRHKRAVEECEDLSKEWLECWHRQSDECVTDFGHFDGEQAVVAPRLIRLVQRMNMSVAVGDVKHCELNLPATAQR